MVNCNDAFPAVGAFLHLSSTALCCAGSADHTDLVPTVKEQQLRLAWTRGRQELLDHVLGPLAIQVDPVAREAPLDLAVP